MKTSSYHLNLLSEAEKLSSSPIRVRIMLPVLAILAVIGTAVWWGALTTRIVMVHSKSAAIRDELDSKSRQHEAIIGDMTLANERDAEMRQLEFYRGGCVHWGDTLRRIAEVTPVKVQLLRMSIPEPRPQTLKDPKNPKRPPLLGPTNDTEAVTLVLSGRTARDTAVLAFMGMLEDEQFTNALRKVTVKSFQQEAASDKSDEERLLTFEIECRAAERRFAK